MSHFNSPNDTSRIPTATTDAAPAAPSESVNAYEAPAIENIFSPDDLQREVLYAGMIQPSISGGGGPFGP